ncbi:MAG TPA: class I SAM-dependent methyltransferase [Terriglobales bacterium]|nr:class I SAM-dependent methyltransferase [Terriglobales bacterium]
MDIDSIAIDRYATHSIQTVRGYMSSLDALVIAALLKYQDKTSITGHLCEIGVHHGRLFLMLALARRPGERSLAIDLFEDDAMNSGTEHAGRDRALFVNAHRLQISLSDQEIFKTSSLDIKAADILKRTTGAVRFFSVDGGHLYKEVENDLRLAEQTLTPDGIMAVDDFFNPLWADVSIATGEFLRHTDKLVPFAITAKLYLSTPALAEKYQTSLRELADVAQISSVQILGKDVLALRQSVLKRGVEVLRERLRAALA